MTIISCQNNKKNKSNANDIKIELILLAKSVSNVTGNIGNFQINSSGQGKITFSTDLWCLACKDDKKNIIGKTIIINQGEDDFISQHSGAAGTRIICSAIIK
tara:strand:- start:992 stop:1297 length:306 start_codon:yes stop_codon:yes gene_type:complete